MGGMSAMHWLLVLGVVVFVLGTSKMPRIASDIAKGLRTFRAEMRELRGEGEPIQPGIISKDI